jgi:hypothetical protein
MRKLATENRHAGRPRERCGWGPREQSALQRLPAIAPTPASWKNCQWTHRSGQSIVGFPRGLSSALLDLDTFSVTL